MSQMIDISAWMEMVSSEERTIAETFAALKRGGLVEFDEMSERLFMWAQKWIDRT